MRLFFSLWPEAPVRDAIIHGTRDAVAACDGRAVDADRLHLTLAFLHHVDPARLPCIRQAAEHAAGDAFSLTLQTIGHWPRSGILWAAPSPRCTALEMLEARLWQALAACNFKPEFRPFKPHVTLARRATTPCTGTMAPVHWQVRDFVLVESVTDLSRSTYRIVDRWPLHASGD